MKRLFLAINLPPEVKTELYRVQEDLKKVFKRSQITWVDPEIAHITLHFLGDVLEEDMDALTRELRAGEYPEPFELELRSTSCFPNPKKPKILFVETSNHTAATGIHKRTAKTLVENGFDIDDRPWVPHITLGRVVTQSETGPIDGLEVAEVKFIVKNFELMESVLTPQGSQYTVIDSIAL